MANLSRRQLAKVVVDKLDGGMSPTKLANELAAYLLVEHRAQELEPLMRDVTDIRASRGNLEATATSALKLETSAKKSIEQFVHVTYPNTKHITLHEENDPNLVGGVKVTALDTQLDLSVRGRLDRIAHKVAVKT